MGFHKTCCKCWICWHDPYKICTKWKKLYIFFGKEQIQLVLVVARRSFVVGFGNNPPQYTHHAGSSCPKHISVRCDWDAYLSSEPNSNIPYGDLVGGPSSLAELWSYKVERDDYTFFLIRNSGFDWQLEFLIFLPINRNSSFLFAS